MCERGSLKFRGNNLVRRKFWCIEHDTLAAKIACITWNEAISEFLRVCKTDNSIKCITSRPNVLCMINTGLLLTDVNAIYLYIWFTARLFDFFFQDVIIKTLITAHPILKHNYRTCFPNHNKGSACFEILGFDILLDKKLKAWVLEVKNCKVRGPNIKLIF